MNNVFIRGIYSTALTKMFLDAGYNIIDSSPLIQKRFNLKPDKENKIKEIIIQDRDDRQGIIVYFSTFKKNIESPSELISELPLNQEKFPELITLISNYTRNSIYKGEVIRTYKNRGYSIVDLMAAQEFEENDEQLTINNYKPDYGIVYSYYNKNYQGFFQVIQEDSGRNPPILVPFNSLSGNYIVLLLNGNSRILFSKKIQSSNIKSNLFNLGKTFELNGIDIIFRTAAMHINEDFLRDEFDNLLKLIKSLEMKMKQKESLGLIYQDTISCHYLFPGPFKLKMDEIRRKSGITIENHHSFKSSIHSQSQKFDLVIDFNEYLLEKFPENEQKINSSFKQFIHEIYFQKDGILPINHQKILVKIESLSPAKIIEISEKLPLKLKVKREFKSRGRFDGLNIPIEKGDYALVQFTEGEWSYKNEYFDQYNSFKGAYYNINTPIEIRPTEIHYIDLEVDVIEFEDGKKEVIDKELFDALYEHKIISKETYERGNQEISKIINE